MEDNCPVRAVCALLNVWCDVAVWCLHCSSRRAAAAAAGQSSKHAFHALLPVPPRPGGATLQAAA